MVNIKQKNKLSNLLFLLIFSILLITASSFSAIPQQINFQGRLVGNDGQPITGQVTIDFMLYNNETTGTPIWTETHTLNIVIGIFNVVLGSSTILTPEILQSGNLWLGMRVSGDTLLPRQKLVSSPYAILSGNSEKLSGYSYTAFLSTSGGSVKSLSSGTTFYMVPKGAIIMWSGTIASIPPGWALCDGTKGTPDLRDRFICSVSTGETPGLTGGTTLLSLTTTQMPAHNHSVTINSGGTHSHDLPAERNLNAVAGSDGGFAYMHTSLGTFNTASSGSHTHTATAGSTGADESIDIRPKFYKLAFIMKL